MVNDHFTPVLQAFGSSIGIEGLSLDECQSCTLSIDDHLVTLQLADESETLLVYAPVGMVDVKAPDTAQLMQLLEANCLGMGTGRLALGVQPVFGAIILSGQLPTRALEPVTLGRFIEFFAAMAEEWTDRLGRPQTSPEESSEVPGMPVGIRV